MSCKKCEARVKMVVAIAVIALFTGGWNDGSAPAFSHNWREKPGRDNTSFWAHKGGSLPENPSLELEDGEHGFALTPDEQPRSLLVIDVEKSGRISIPDIGVVSDEVVTKEVKERVDKYGTDFPCLIRADKETPHNCVRKVMCLCAEGGMWKFSFIAGLPPSEDGRRSGFSKLNVSLPSPDDLPQEDEEPVELEPPPAEVEPPPDQDMPDIQLDMPTVSLVETTDVAPASNEPVTMKPATVDATLNIKSPVKLKSVVGTARGAGVRGNFLKGGALYGDANTERAVLKALRWLKATQITDEKSPDYGTWGTKPELGLTKGMDKAAGAGFAVLTFLAHGETPVSKEFGPTVEKAVNYLINNVYVVKGKDGKEAKDPNDLTPYVKMRGASGSEYGFLIGTYALCEAYAMTQNPNARAAAEKALARIISGQTPTGGWNYNLARVTKFGAPDDISYGGWALQALKAGKMAGIHLPGMEECIKKAVKCLKTRNYSEKAGFVYRATTNHKAGGGGLAGTGCLAMQLLGYAKEREVANALRVMADWQPSLDKEYPYVKNGTRHNPQYYCYYATQCKYQAGMARNATPANFALWKKWNAEMKALYPKAIITVMDQKTNQPYTIPDANGRPREIGHWVNQDHYNYDVMGTCLAALQLMVYYRYLPATMLRAAEVEVDVAPLSKDKTDEVNVEIDI